MLSGITPMLNTLKTFHGVYSLMELPKKTVKCMRFHVWDVNLSSLGQCSVQHGIEHWAPTSQHVLVSSHHFLGIPNAEGDIAVNLVVQHVTVALSQGLPELPFSLHAFIVTLKKNYTYIHWKNYTYCHTHWLKYYTYIEKIAHTGRLKIIHIVIQLGLDPSGA